MRHKHDFLCQPTPDQARRTGYGLLLLLFMAFPGGLHAQKVDSPAVDIAKIRFDVTIQRPTQLVALDKPPSSPAELPSLPFQRWPNRQFYARFPANYMEKTLVLRFSLYNSSDTSKSVYYLPGYYCRNIRLYKAPVTQPGQLALIDSHEEPPHIKRIHLLPHEKAVFYCQFNFVRTNTNIFLPYLIEEDYLHQWESATHERDQLLDVCNYIATGMLLMMIFYSLAVYAQNRNREFIFYAIYTLLTCSLLFMKSYMNATHSAFNYFYEEYLDFMVMTASVVAYLVFVRHFINTREQHPGLDKFLRVVKWMLAAASIAFSVIYFFTSKYIVLSIMENYIIKLVFFITGLTFIIYSIKKRNRLLSYLAAGNLSLLVFAVMSQCIIMYKWKISATPSSILNRAMFYYETGVVLELILFLSGLAYKNKRDIIDRVKERERLKLENERKEFDKQMAVLAAKQEERNRISADMHDELGSGVTAIRLMSEIVKSKMKDAHFAELEKISNSANDLHGKMNTIIWTMKSSNDTIESLIAYIRAHALEYFDSTPIDCTVKVPAVIPQKEISGEERRNIFLSVKEALNNAMKHSQATHLQIDIATADGRLVIRITDNGVGIDPEKLRRFGNGLSNMRRRMESINGTFNIESSPGNCVLVFDMPI